MSLKTISNQQLLRLLQLASPLLPVGGYSYSEGLESLISQGIVRDRVTLQAWIRRELQVGAIRVETAIMDRAYLAGIDANIERLQYWNQWLSAARETEELRQQSWQMGGSLIKLVVELTPEIQDLITAIVSGLVLSVRVASAFAEVEVASVHDRSTVQLRDRFWNYRTTLADR